MLIFLFLSLLNFNPDSILVRAGENASEVKKFILISQQKGYQNWAQFLLSAMPDVDLVNLKADDFINYFDALNKNYQRVPWKNIIDTNLFYHYILPHRVSQEPLENFTEIYVDTLYNLIKKTRNMRDAVFKINEWVYTKMVYEPTEYWDQNALTTIKRGIGRCEEMSILFIKALRTVCIPARHTYTPWWAHTNSNHAWVEIWVDGKWHSLGGGELTDLDNAWFETPSKRAPIIKSIVYGQLSSEKEIIDKSESNYTIINSTPNYSDVTQLYVQVKQDNLPIENASVSINVYNYSSFVPVGLKKTDLNGYVQWYVGKTDLYIYAYKNAQIGYYIWRPSDKPTDTVIIILSKNEIPDTSFWLYTKRISSNNYKSKYKPNTKLLNKIREKNLTKINIFDSLSSQKLNNIDTNLSKILQDAHGNAQTLLQFYSNLPTLKKITFIQYCNTLTSKDLVALDTVGLFKELSAIQRAVNQYKNKISDSIIRDFLICPRIQYEQLGKWRFSLQSVIDEYHPLLFAPSSVIPIKEKVDSIINWVRTNIKLIKEDDVFGPMMNPQDVYKAKRATKIEQYIFIVGMLRSIGIPSRIKWSEDGFEYWDGDWQEESFDAKIKKQKAWVSIKFEANNLNVTDKTKYYEDYSITKFHESPTRFEPPIDTFNGHAVITLDNEPPYLITGWRNGFGDTYLRIKRIMPTVDTTYYTIKLDIPVDFKPGDLMVRAYQEFVNLDKVKLSSQDINIGDVLLIVIDADSEASKSTINNAWDAINNFSGKVYIFHTSKKRGLQTWYFNLLDRPNRFGHYVNDEIIKSWHIKELPSVIYLRNGECLFWMEGLNLHLSKIIQTLQTSDN